MNAPEEQYSEAVLQAVDAGRKIEAIKLLCEETGLGLKDSKQAIDRLIRKRHPVSPTAGMMVEQGGAGWLIKIVLLIVVAIVVYKAFIGN